MLRNDKGGDSSVAAPSREQVEAELHRILDSSVFRNAPRHSRFLQFVVNQTLAGKAEEVTEYVIGLDVFDRASDYDPGSDPTVRAEARRLRSRLADYYQQFGQRDAVHIELPKGTYVPVFHRNGVADTDLPSVRLTDPAAAIPPELGSLVSAPPLGPAPPQGLKDHRRWIPWVVVIVVIVLAAGFAVHWLKSRTPAKAPADVASLPNLVVLSDFTNTTGDPIFHSTLRQALAAQLEQSPFINLLPESRIAPTLALMSQPKGARLTRRLTREICQRVAGMASIEGSIGLQGSHYIVALEAVNCRTGKTMATAEATADNKQQVLSALRQAATRLRRGIGESMASVSRYDVPPENATTASLEALQAYSLGCHAMIALGDYEAAIPFFQRAIKLDPNFAMAYARLGTSYENVGQSNLGPANLRNAYALRQRVSDRERFYIDSHYYEIVTGDLVAARAVYELWAQTYPGDVIPLIALGRAYTELGDYEKSLAAYQKALSLDGGSGLLYANLIFTYVSLNRLDEARATAKEAQRLHFDSPWNNSYLYWADFIQHDTAGMAREVAPDVVKPDTADLAFNIEASTAAYGGQMAKAADLAQRAADGAKHADQKDAAAGYLAINAVHEALAGEIDIAKQHAAAAAALSSQREVQAVVALALALSGDTHLATQVATDLSNRYPEDTSVQLIHLPTIHGAIALQEGNGAKAVEALAPAAPYELGRGDVIWLYPVFIRAQAYLAARQSTAAVAQFQFLLDHPGLVLNDPIGALAHLGLARAYAQSGDTARARTAYQDFLALWNDADPQLPLLQQAQLEYSHLP